MRQILFLNRYIEGNIKGKYVWADKFSVPLSTSAVFEDSVDQAQTAKDEQSDPRSTSSISKCAYFTKTTYACDKKYKWKPLEK